MKLLKLATIVVLGSAPIFATTVYSSICTAYDTAPVTGTASCISDPSGVITPRGPTPDSGSFAVVTSSLSTTLANDPGTYSDIHAVQTSILGVGTTTPFTVRGAGSEGYSQMQFSDTFATSGPVRSGFLFLHLVDNNSRIAEGAIVTDNFSTSLTPTGVGGTGVGCANPVQDDCSGVWSYLEHYNNLGGLPVTLGQSFVLNYTGTLNTAADGYSGNGTGYIDLDYQFRFIDSDGITPVSVLAATGAPEPTTVVLVGLSLVACALIKRN